MCLRSDCSDPPPLTWCGTAPLTPPPMAVCVPDFWTSGLTQQDQNQNRDQNWDQDHISDPVHHFLYVDPVSVGGSFDSNHDVIPPQLISPSLQNGEPPQNVSTEVKGHTKSLPNKEIKYKRTPPRPPSLGPGMGLLFSAPPPVHGLPDRKEEGRRDEEGREERRLMSVSPPPSRPPVPQQSRAPPPPQHPAPIHRAEKEPGQSPENDKEEGGDGAETENSRHGEKEVKNGGEEGERRVSASDPPAPKKPSRPVPPPRRRPCAPDAPVGSSTNQSTATREAPPSPARRPDVSLYSPQGGAVLGTDPDSCSTSSTEEEEQNQEQDHRWVWNRTESLSHVGTHRQEMSTGG